MPREDRVVERREHDLVQARVGAFRRLGGIEEARLHLREARVPREHRERLGHERLRVGEVGEVVAQRERRERVDRLGSEQAAGTQLRVGELQEAQQHRRRKVLHDLRREDAAERAHSRAIRGG